MTKYLLVLVASIAVVSCAKTPCYEGQWRVVSAKFPGVSAVGVDDIEPLLGQVGTISNAALTLGNRQCDAPALSAMQVDRAAFEFDYRLRFSALGFEGESLSMLRAECAGSAVHPFSTLIHNNGLTYSIWEGAFVELERP